MSKAVTLCSLKELTNPSVSLGHTVILDSNSFPSPLFEPDVPTLLLGPNVGIECNPQGLLS